ncbi:glycosyltransferase, partial [Klebsiella pneumoniae]
DQLARLKPLAQELGIAGRITWKGALAQEEVLAHYRRADIFALACRIAADGDRDGLPNVLVEASSQNLVC